jgi:hypothetical protein
VVDHSGTSNDIIERLRRHGCNTDYIRRTEDGLGMWLAVFDHTGDLVASISRRPGLEELSVATGVPVSLWATGQVSSDALVREVINADAISTQLALADAMIDDAASRRGMSRTAYLNQIDGILAAEAKDAYGLMRDAGPARDAARIAYRTRLDSPGIDAAKGLLESYLRVSGIDASQAGMDAVIKRITSDADRMTEARTELRRVVEKLEGMAQDPRITRK